MGVINKVKEFFGLASEEEYVEETVETEPDRHDFTQKRHQTAPRNNVVSLHTAREQTGIRLMLFEPRGYADAQDIADNLRQRRPVVLNLQRVDRDQAKRIIDFLSGTVYALNGDIQKVGDHIFVCTPEHVDIQGTISSVVEE